MAHAANAKVLRYETALGYAGEVSLELAVARDSSAGCTPVGVAFGGEALGDLLITTAEEGALLVNMARVPTGSGGAPPCKMYY